MELTVIQFLAGFFALILAISSIYVGIHIASRYRKVNSKIFLYIGIGWIGLFNAFWPSAINFILVITTGTTLSEVQYFIIGLITSPIFFFIWMIGVTELLYKKKQKLILMFALIYGIIYEFILFYYVFTDPSKIGELQGPVDVKYAGLILLLLLVIISLVLITGILFTRHSLKSESKENKLRGIFLLYAFIVYFIGMMLDAGVDLNVITLPIVRLFLISCSLACYIGIIMPKFIKKILLKSD